MGERERERKGESEKEREEKVIRGSLLVNDLCRGRRDQKRQKMNFPLKDNKLKVKQFDSKSQR